jgi:hypothetical protein
MGKLRRSVSATLGFGVGYGLVVEQLRVLRCVAAHRLDDLLAHGALPVVAAPIARLDWQSEVEHDCSEVVALPGAGKLLDALVTRAAPLTGDGRPQLAFIQANDLLGRVQVLEEAGWPLPPHCG